MNAPTEDSLMAIIVKIVHLDRPDHTEIAIAREINLMMKIEMVVMNARRIGNCSPGT